MDAPEYVETSDPEELEIAHGAHRIPPIAEIAQLMPLQPKPNLQVPRKRRKLLHSASILRDVSESDVAFEQPGLRDSDDGSATPFHSSPGPSTSTAVSDGEWRPRTTIAFSEKNGPFTATMDRSNISELVSRAISTCGLPKRGPSDNGSHDELDVISQPLREIHVASVYRMSTTSPSGTSIGERPYLEIMDPAERGTPERPRGSLDLFPSQHGFGSGYGRKCAEDFEPKSPTRHSAGRPRFASLPPSSPPRTSPSITNTPQRSLSQSPNHRSIQSRSVNLGPRQIPRGDTASAPHSSSADQDGTTPRRYSLRTRQARQLNPYEYDKRLYKQQMKRLPDAIVKVISPRRDDSKRIHKHREINVDDDFIASEDDDESRETGRGASNIRESLAAPHHEDEARTDSLSWLPETFQMNDDDDLTPLSPLAGRVSLPKSTREGIHVHKTHRADRIRPARFPLREAKLRNAEQSALNAAKEIEKHQNTGHLITYRRRKDIQLGSRGRTARASNNASLAESELREPLSDRGTPDRCSSEVPSRTGGKDEHEHNAVQDEREDATGSNPADENSNGYQTFYDDGVPENSDYAFYSSQDVPQDDGPEPARSDSQSDTDADDELSRINKKRMKALRRMMPAVMIARLRGKDPSSAKRPTQPRPTVSMDTQESSSDNDETSLAPGRSRATKCPIVDRGLRQIKGDSGSSEVDSGIGRVNKVPTEGSASVITVESSSDSEASTTSSLHGDVEDDVSENSIPDAGYFDHDYTRQTVRWREEPLIDMMLCRTRTKKSSSTAKARRRRSGTGSWAGGDHLRANGLNVNTARSPPRPHSRVHRGRKFQTRLPFKSADSAVLERGGDTIDLTNLDSGSAGDGSSDNEIGSAEKYEPAKRLTGKQKREAAQKATLHTFTGHGKRIASGRKKGFITVQIDMADDGLRDAIKPLHQDGTLRAQPTTFARTMLAKVASPIRRISHCRYPVDSESALRQASLHDFEFDGEPVPNTLDYGPSTRRHDTALSRPTDWRDEDRVRTCTVDMGISVPTPGLAFGAGTFLGKQLLRSLLEFGLKDGNLPRPSSYVGFGLISLDPEMLPSCFTEAIEAACNILSEWLDEEASEFQDEDDTRRYEHLMHAVSHFAPWIYANANGEGRQNVQAATSSCIDRLTRRLHEKPEKTYTGTSRFHVRRLAVLWFGVELATRMLVIVRQIGSQLDTTSWMGAVTLLIKALMDYGIDRALVLIESREMASSNLPLRVAELWICMIHLLGQADCFCGALADGPGAFWSIVLQVFRDDLELTMTNVEISEYLWKLVFGLCALSHFSSHGIVTSDPRLLPCWDIVTLALDAIRLAHDKIEDAKVPRESLKRRDRYVRIIVARCFTLGTKWKWPLRKANVLFKKLVDIFRSRNFGNLLGEESEFPAFLRYQDVSLLSELRGSDSSYGLYLKLVMEATKPDPDTPRNEARTKARLTKLLSLVVPLSGVAFSKRIPPTADELSMLINRFSAIIIAILVEGKEAANMQNRTSQARRFVSFVDADDRSRDLCIKAAMYISIAANHLSLDSGDSLKWLAEMCQTLLDEFQQANTEVSKEADVHKSGGPRRVRHRLVISLHLLLRCIANIIEKPTLKWGGHNPQYPDVGLISGPWVRRVFPNKELTNMVSTRLQILKLVQSFLKARARVIPSPRRPLPATAPEGNSESQDFFAEFDLDDDILALVPLDDEAEGNWKKDKEAAEIMNSDMIPHIFRLLLQYFNDPTARPSDESKLDDFWSNADDWIDCWVGCAAVVVRNRIRTWDHYLNVGPQSWAGIGDSFFRRRVAIRFMYRLLKCDPTAYEKDHEKHFLAVLLHCLVAHRVAMENEYLSAVFSVDGFRHPLLRELPVNRVPEQEEFHLSRADFVETRNAIITSIFANLNSILLSGSSDRDKNILVECVLEMLSAMQDIWQSLSSTEDCDKYSELCRHLFSEIRRHPRVCNLQRLSAFVAWGSSFDEQRYKL